MTFIYICGDPSALLRTDIKRSLSPTVQKNSHLDNRLRFTVSIALARARL